MPLPLVEAVSSAFLYMERDSSRRIGAEEHAKIDALYGAICIGVVNRCTSARPTLAETP